ncbi:MAG: endonuclease III [Clostridia bacterium]
MKNKAKLVMIALAEKYPDIKCGLDADGSPFKLLIMAILSAQCTDKRVNLVSKELFLRFPTPQSIAESKIGELEDVIRSVGLFNTKSKNIRNCCKTICENFDGKVPSGMNELLSLGGVGRKVANLIRGDVFNLGGIVADTHCIRISGRLGLADGKSPQATEKALEKLILLEMQSDFCHRIVVFGRETCKAQSPCCDNCFLKKLSLCDYEYLKKD